MNENEIKQCRDLLAKLKPGFLPLPIFEQIARLVRLPVIDVIPIKKEGDKLLVGMLKRPSDDIWWPGAWHLPGTIFRSTDNLETAFKRLINDEIKALKNGEIKYVDQLIHGSERGTELILIHTVENCVLAADSPINWFEIDDLPKKMVESEKLVLNCLQKQI